MVCQFECKSQMCLCVIYWFCSSNEPVCPGEPQVHAATGECNGEERDAWLVAKTDRSGAETGLPRARLWPLAGRVRCWDGDPRKGEVTVSVAPHVNALACFILETLPINHKHFMSFLRSFCASFLNIESFWNITVWRCAVTYIGVEPSIDFWSQYKHQMLSYFWYQCHYVLNI